MRLPRVPAPRAIGGVSIAGGAALYTALDPKTAWMEAQQGMPFKAQPLTLVAYRLDCEPIVDLTDGAVLASAAIDPADPACPWEDLVARGLEPPSWRLADALLDAGWHGAIVPSFAPGAAVSASPMATTVGASRTCALQPRLPASWHQTSAARTDHPSVRR